MPGCGVLAFPANCLSRPRPGSHIMMRWTWSSKKDADRGGAAVDGARSPKWPFQSDLIIRFKSVNSRAELSTLLCWSPQTKVSWSVIVSDQSFAISLTSIVQHPGHPAARMNVLLLSTMQSSLLAALKVSFISAVVKYLLEFMFYKSPLEHSNSSLCLSFYRHLLLLTHSSSFPTPSRDLIITSSLA